MAPSLRCTAGALAGQELLVDHELVFGRGMPEPGALGGDAQLSRRHARLFTDGSGRLHVEDLGSTNGTFVNGERLTEERVLGSGDVLSVGRTRFEVIAAGETAVPPDATVASAARAAPDDRAERALGQSSLRVLAGPSEGAQLPLTDELVIGRSFGEPGALGGDRLLSRRHCRIARGPGGLFFVEDLGSSNGTFINEQQLRRAQPLTDGDVIRVGSTKLEAVGMPRAALAEELPPAVEEPAPETGAALAGAGAYTSQGEAGARLSSRRLVTIFGLAFAAAAVVAVIAVVVVAPLGSSTCPQGFVCHKPPTSPPLRALTTFRGALGWRVEYDPQMATPATASSQANQLDLHESNAQDKNWGLPAGSKFITASFRAYRSSQKTAQAAMQSMASSLESNLVGAASAPSSDQMFTIPSLGFHAAKGEVLEGDLKTPQGPGPLIKVAVMAASSGGVTIAAGVIYQVQTSQTQQNNPDRPLDQFGDSVLNTVRFPSDGSA